MKNLKFLWAILFIAAAVISCEKEDDPTSLDSLNGKKALDIVNSEIIVSTPVSDSGITPVIIPGENNGGNRTCEEVAIAFNTSFDMCGDKINYDEDIMGFDGSFPEGLEVTLDGIYVSFEMDDCLMIGDSYYKVGAVIVKGSNSANVYYYPDGTTADGHLAAPGDEFMVSNLTFCFVECEDEEEDYTIVVKSFYWNNYSDPGSVYDFAVSSGDKIFKSISTGWCYNMGVGYYPDDTSLDLLGRGTDIGDISIVEDWIDGVHSLVVTIELSLTEGMLDVSYLYFGTESDLLADLAGDDCPNYTSWLTEESVSKTHTFVIPLE